MIPLDGRISLFHNPKVLGHEERYPAHLESILDIGDVPQVTNDIRQWPGYRPTPLHHLAGIADEIGVKDIWYKDESARFGLGSFKALGGAYAVAQQLIKYLQKLHDREIAIKDLLSGEYIQDIRDITVSCATDGNHGRSVAWGAQMFGCRCVIYLHEHVSVGREVAIAEYGAEIVRIQGNYDDSVQIAASDAIKHNRIIVSDTSYSGYVDIPKDVALGYTVMLDEIVNALNSNIPTHVFVQGGVGGLASAVCAFFWQYWEKRRPRLILVEPEKANCLQQSAVHHQPTKVEGELDTLMAGLSCGEVSMLAWEILKEGADDFMTIDEKSVPATMKLLAEPDQDGVSITAGESAVAGLAALIVACEDPETKKALGINDNSSILLFGTEGATDPEVYQKLTGLPA